MINLIKILLFGIVNAAGYFSYAIIANVAVMTETHPRFATQEDLEAFKYLYYAGAPIVWGIAAFLSIGYFFAKSAETRFLLIVAPIFAPSIYCIGLMLYCNFSSNL